MGELFSAEPDTFSVEHLQTYFSNLFVKNPLSRTDRLYFVDHLMAGVAEALPATGQETFAAPLAKAELDRVYDSPVMAAHHALLGAVYGFSRSRDFRRVVVAEARDDFHDLCDVLSAVLDQKAGTMEEFVRVEALFLQKLGPAAGDPSLSEFFREVQTLTVPPPSIH